MKVVVLAFVAFAAFVASGPILYKVLGYDKKARASAQKKYPTLIPTPMNMEESGDLTMFDTIDGARCYVLDFDDGSKTMSCVPKRFMQSPAIKPSTDNRGMRL